MKKNLAALVAGLTFSLPLSPNAQSIILKYTVGNITIYYGKIPSCAKNTSLFIKKYNQNGFKYTSCSSNTCYVYTFGEKPKKGGVSLEYYSIKTSTHTLPHR